MEGTEEADRPTHTKMHKRDSRDWVDTETETRLAHGWRSPPDG